MADFIDRDKTEQDIINRDSRISAAVADIDSYLTGKAQMQMEILDIIREQPTVDTERHAHWEQSSYFDEENNVFQCSNCKEEFVLISGSPKENGYEYCPHCGYKMDEAIHRCGDCTFIDTDCKDCVDEDETFSEVGGCGNFKRKEE